MNTKLIIQVLEYYKNGYQDALEAVRNINTIFDNTRLFDTISFVSGVLIGFVISTILLNVLF